MPGKKQAGKEKTKVSCQFFMRVPVLAVCKELPCFPSNFVCIQTRLVHFFPLVIFRPSFCTVDYFECTLRVTWTFLWRGSRGWHFLEERFPEFGAVETRVQSLVTLQINSRRKKAGLKKIHWTKRKLKVVSRNWNLRYHDIPEIVICHLF